jgi:hypothetical protein
MPTTDLPIDVDPSRPWPRHRTWPDLMPLVRTVPSFVGGPITPQM